ncbi:hypothetical protein D9758_005606 [Tetrapyrgos nigripes]|uniref:Uncharacterized protein n=1 Tax=Tetrapyrgos nigripes TaxID=182062 RepID=A0A8H5GGN3_9AGAR|nr:hypothetical protein D9758_005606 [Tetrapyrgos nigripes]
MSSHKVNRTPLVRPPPLPTGPVFRSRQIEALERELDQAVIKYFAPNCPLPAITDIELALPQLNSLHWWDLWNVLFHLHQTLEAKYAVTQIWDSYTQVSIRRLATVARGRGYRSLVQVLSPMQKWIEEAAETAKQMIALDVFLDETVGPGTSQAANYAIQQRKREQREWDRQNMAGMMGEDDISSVVSFAEEWQRKTFG